MTTETNIDAFLDSMHDRTAELIEDMQVFACDISTAIQKMFIASGSPNIPEVHNITFDPIGGRDGKAVGPGRTGRHVISGPAGELAGVRERTA